MTTFKKLVALTKRGASYVKSNHTLIRERDDLIRQRDDLMLQRNNLMTERDRLIHQVSGSAIEGGNHSIPSILLNTLPKSASVFILETLAITLGKPVITVSSGYFPRDQIDFRQFRKLIDSKGIAQSHLDASAFNQRYLKKIDKVILQFRDPRQATLSWLHHLERLHKEEQHDLLFSIDPILPVGYFELDLSKKIDYQLGYYLPQIIEWQMEWVNFIDTCNEPERFLLTNYEDFVKDSDAYFRSIFKFLSCAEPDKISLHQAIPTTEKNYRKGLIDEWKTIFSNSQNSQATESIPSILQSRFGWI